MNKFKIINNIEAKKIIDNEKCIVLDVRTYEEFEQGYIYDAINLPLDEIYSKIEQVIPNKEEKILIYCRSGVRSKEAGQIIANKGYTNVFEFGGIIDWPFELVL